MNLRILALGILSLSLAATTQAGVVKRAPIAKKTGPVGKPFINGVTGHTSHMDTASAAKMSEFNAGAVRMWLSVYNWNDPMGNKYTAQSVNTFKKKLKELRDAGFHIFMTVAISDYIDKSGYHWGFYFKGDPKVKKNWFSTQPSKEEVEKGMRSIATELKGLVDDYGILNEPGHTPYWDNDVQDLTKLHYMNRFLLPMTTAIRSVDKSAKVFAAVPWCGAHSAKSQNQVFSQILAIAKGNSNAVPDGFDCHVYAPTAEEIGKQVGFFRTALNSFIPKVRALGYSNFNPQIAVSEFNCKASPDKEKSTGKQGPAADICIKKVYKDVLIKLVDQAYYFVFYPYAKRPFDDILTHRGDAFKTGTDFLFSGK